MQIKQIFINLILKLIVTRQRKGEKITMEEWVNDAIREKIKKEPTF